MKGRVAVVLAVLAGLVASLTTAVALTVTDDGWSSHRGAMMSARGDDRTDVPGSSRPSWQSQGSMMPGGMYGTRVVSEYAYLAEMVAHHEEAVTAAQELRRSQRPEMRAFGESIVASQTAQIDQMRQWLAEWYPNRSGQVDYRPMMRGLAALSGDRLDRAFLADMTWHHMGAVMMSQQLLARDAATHAQVEVLARTIRDEQRAEIFQMRQWLRLWFGGGSHPGMYGPMHGGIFGGMH